MGKMTEFSAIEITNVKIIIVCIAFAGVHQFFVETIIAIQQKHAPIVLLIVGVTQGISVQSKTLASKKKAYLV